MHSKLEVNLKLANHEWNLKFTAMCVNPTIVSTLAESYMASQINDVKMSTGKHPSETNLITTSQPQAQWNLRSSNCLISVIWLVFASFPMLDHE